MHSICLHAVVKILEVGRREGTQVAVIGTLYKEQKLKPSILDEYTKVCLSGQGGKDWISIWFISPGTAVMACWSLKHGRRQDVHHASSCRPPEHAASDGVLALARHQHTKGGGVPICVCHLP
jgi:hypothetical protein